MASWKWPWEALHGEFMSCFIFINLHVSWHPYQWEPIMICQFHQGLMENKRLIQNYLGSVKGLNGSFITHSAG
jgi:hypothetical protein